MKCRAVVCSLEIIFAAALGMFGCATTESIQPSAEQAGITTAQEAPSEGKLITGISIEETADAIVVSIMANHVVDYTLAEPPLQQAKVLYFPDSALSLPATEYPIENDVIGTIEAVELVKGGPSKIVIPVKSPGVACEAHRGDDDTVLNVVFPGSASGQTSASGIQSENIAEEAVAPVASSDAEEAVAPVDGVWEQPSIPATRLETVAVQEEADRVSVKIKADGTIKQYKQFTLKGPPRIVVDLSGLTSSYKKEQRLAVGSEMVQQIRHCGHKGYVRVVLDVDPAGLSDYKVVSVHDGLMVYVGNTAELDVASYEQAPLPPAGTATTAPAAEATEEDTTVYIIPAEEPMEETADTVEDDVAEVEEEIAYAEAGGIEEESIAGKVNVAAGQYDRPALVNQIDFIDEQGSSTIRIGTTHPVNFEVVKTGVKKARLTLENADILSFRQRPLITTRFDSAINSILPVQTQAMKEKGISVVDINLREDVGYTTEQQGNMILVHFDPSTVPPDPAQVVVIPTGETVVSDATKAVSSTDIGEEPEGDAMTTAAPVMPGASEGVSGPDGWVEDEPAVSGVETEGVGSLPLTQPNLLAGGKKAAYTGEPIALEFYKTDIRNVIRILKDVSGKNFAIDEGVSGSVTLSFVNPVPWDQVLDLILEMNDLGMIEQNGIVRISTKDTILKQKEAARAAMAAEQELKTTEEQLAPLVTEYFAISYSDASADVLPHITDILTPERGHAKVDSRTNQLIMTDIQEKIDRAREIIEKIDKVTPQVMINARIVETSTNFSRDFGTEWGIDNSPGTYRNELGGTYNYNVAMNNPAPASNILGFNFSRIVGTPFSLDAKLSLMESVGEVRIISSPRIVTLDNKQATISQGQEIPYTSISSDKAETEFKDADLKLEVTPHVTPDNRISMKIHIEEKEVGEQGAGSEPPLNTKEATTELLVNDGDTIVIGGIIQETEKEGQSGIPLLSKIPLLGHLFKQQSRSSDKSELLIFITPTIVRLD